MGRIIQFIEPSQYALKILDCCIFVQVWTLKVCVHSWRLKREKMGSFCSKNTVDDIDPSRPSGIDFNAADNENKEHENQAVAERRRK